jgi:hypothetical protein
MRTPEDYEQAAKSAAARWKANATPQLKDQIIATWRMNKAHRSESGSSIRIGQLQDIWQQAFKDVAGWDFDFTKDDMTTF